MGRKPTCECGECKVCRHRPGRVAWYQKQTPEKRRAIVLARDPEKVRAADRARYERDREKRLAATRANAEKYAERRIEYLHRTRERYPDRYQAYCAVANALRAGRLVKQPCEVCGVADVHAHHDDYSKPLDVRWLCPEHHRQHHAAQRRAA